MHELLARVRDEQRGRWERGERVPAEAYLERYPVLKNDTAAVVDLIYGEVLLREESNEIPTLAEYLQRFTEFAEPLRRQFRLHECLRAGLLGPSDIPPSRLTATEETVPMRPPSSSAEAVAFPTIPGYEILGRLGKGGRGVVYRARQIKLDRIVALKMIRHDEDLEPEGVELFRREAEAVARLEHPNIIRLYDLGEQEGRPYFTMELTAGGRLEDRLEAGPLNPRQAAALVETPARSGMFLVSGGSWMYTFPTLVSGKSASVIAYPYDLQAGWLAPSPTQSVVIGWVPMADRDPVVRGNSKVPLPGQFAWAWSDRRSCLVSAGSVRFPR